MLQDYVVLFQIKCLLIISNLAVYGQVL